jgi:hypothetical protein
VPNFTTIWAKNGENLKRLLKLPNVAQMMGNELFNKFWDIFYLNNLKIDQKRGFFLVFTF